MIDPEEETSDIFIALSPFCSLESNQARRQQVLELLEKTRRTLRSKWDRGRMRHRNHRGEGLAEESRELEGLQEVLDEEGGGGHTCLPLSRLSTGTYVATWRPLKLLRLVAVLLELHWHTGDTRCRTAALLQQTIRHVWRGAVTFTRPVERTQTGNTRRGCLDRESWLINPRVRINAFDFCVMELGYFYSVDVARGQLMIKNRVDVLSWTG